MKKTLAILLSLALVICMIPATAFASGGTDLKNATIEVSDANNIIYNGAAQEPSVTVKVNESSVAASNYTVSYSNNVKAGSATVIVTGNGNQDSGYYGSASGTFTIKPKTITPSVTVTPQSGTYDGSVKTPTVTVKDNDVIVDPENYTLTWKKDSAAADLKVPGEYTPVITFKETGSYTCNNGSFEATSSKYTVNKINITDSDVAITAPNQTLPSNSNEWNTAVNVTVSVNGDIVPAEQYTKTVTYTTGYATAKVTIAPATSSTYFNEGGSKDQTFNVINGSNQISVTVSNSDKIYYTGKAIEPAITVKAGNTTLTNKTHYVANYSNNVNKGTATVTVTGIDSYSTAGTVSTTFEIKQRDITDTNITVGNAAYNNGAPVKLNVSIGNKYATDVPLVENRDYTLTCNDTAKGTATVTITGINNYKGSVTKSFEIVDNAYDISLATITLKNVSAVYDGTSKESAIGLDIKNGNTQLYKGTNYTVSYSYYDEYEKKTLTPSYPVNKGVYTMTITGKTPYVGSTTRTFTVTEFPAEYLTVTATASSPTAVPTVTVKSFDGKVVFSQGRDYTVSGPTKLYSGMYRVTVTPTSFGNIQGTTPINKDFSIAGKSIAYCSVEFATGSKQSYQYTGSVIKPQVKVRDGYTPLTEGTDYTVTYKDAAGKVVYSPKDAGTYTIVIEGKGAYSGTTTLTFYIVGTDISGYTVTLKEASVNATGYAQTPVITSVKKGYYYSLTANDYTVSYQDSTGKTVTSMSAPGTYKVVVTGKNGYSGSTYATFRIVGLPQTVTVTQDSYKVYATSDSFKITAKASGDATGFTYTSSNPAVASVSSTGYVTMHKVGRAVITVTATGMKKYDPASTTVEVKVYPKKGYITKKPWTDGKKYQAKVRWTYQDGATSYQVKYSRDKNFGAGTYKIKTVKAHGKDYTTQSTTLKSLKSKSTYYIKVRAVYKDPVTGDTYYGAWSGWRSVKTK